MSFVIRKKGVPTPEPAKKPESEPSKEDLLKTMKANILAKKNEPEKTASQENFKKWLSAPGKDRRTKTQEVPSVAEGRQFPDWKSRVAHVLKRIQTHQEVATALQAKAGEVGSKREARKHIKDAERRNRLIKAYMQHLQQGPQSQQPHQVR
jgi:hypothetical protein